MLPLRQMCAARAAYPDLSPLWADSSSQTAAEIPCSPSSRERIARAFRQHTRPRLCSAASEPPLFSEKAPSRRGLCRSHRPQPRSKKVQTCRTSAWTILMTICNSRSSFQPSLNYQSLMLARYVLILQWYSFIILYSPYWSTIF